MVHRVSQAPPCFPPSPTSLNTHPTRTVNTSWLLPTCARSQFEGQTGTLFIQMGKWETFERKHLVNYRPRRVTPTQLQLVVYSTGRRPYSIPYRWKRGPAGLSAPGTAGKPGGPGQTAGPVPARLAGLAGGVCFRSGLAPRVHSSWPREGEARQDPGWPQLRRGPAS